MRLKILHRTRYDYSSSVSENYNEVRLQPVSNPTQECHAFRLRTTPAARVERYHDLHLNLVDHFYIGEPHASLLIESESEVTTTGPATDPLTFRFPLARMRECIQLERCYDFLQRSAYVSLEVDVWRFAQDATSGLDDAVEAVNAIMRRIHDEFAYDTAATNVNTHMAEALRYRRGVCQDFAHVMLGACRSVGIPSRYVSGYLHVEPGDPRRGELASHAWVEIFLPGHGWLGFDPTNAQTAGARHVKVAVGRDYADAAPVRGSFRGRAEQKMTMELSIERTEEP